MLFDFVDELIYIFYIIFCILKCLDIMESGLTEKQKEPPPENIEESSVLEFVESLALDEEGKHF